MKTKKEILLKITGVHYSEHSNILTAMEEYGKQCYNQAIDDARNSARWKSESFDSYFGDITDYDFCDTDYAGDKSTIYKISVDEDSILKLKKK